MQVLLEKIKHNKLCQVVLNDDGSASVICDSEVTYTTGPDFMHDYEMYPPTLEFLLDQESKHYFTGKWLENKARAELLYKVLSDKITKGKTVTPLVKGGTT